MAKYKGGRVTGELARDPLEEGLSHSGGIYQVTDSVLLIVTYGIFFLGRKILSRQKGDFLLFLLM